AYAMLAASAGVVTHGLSVAGGAGVDQTMPVYILALVLAIFCTVIPSLLMNKGIGLIGSGRAAIFGVFGPVITLLLGALFLHEEIGAIQLLGATLVIGGVAMTT